MLNGKKTEKLLACIREGQEMTTREKFNLIVELSIPSMLAQISMVLMFFIDAAMVGHLGSAASASIGLIESTLWLVGSVMSAAAIGFAVQVAHFIGAGDFVRARQVFRHALVFGLVFSVVMLLAGVAVHKPLPFWLKGGADIAPMASSYFLVFSFTLPFMMGYHLMADMLKSSGDMRTPSFLSIMMCCLDVAFNYLFIYILHLGVTGAALGTMCAYVVTVVPMARQAMWKSHILALRLDTVRFVWVWDYIWNALKISLPVAVQSVLMSGAQVVSTRIVAPLGNVAIAANSFAITAESLCYMPGYGIGDAASTLVGQTFRCRPPRVMPQLCPHDDRHRHGCNGLHGAGNVCVCARNDRLSIARRRYPPTGNRGAPHRSLCRTVLCSQHRQLQRVRGCWRYRAPCCHESGVDVVRAPHPGLGPRTELRTAGRVDSDGR